MCTGGRGTYGNRCAVLISCARVSTDGRGLTAQRDALTELGVDESRAYVDHGLTGTNHDRPRPYPMPHW